jgi:iron complex outermembrane recepter protein
MFTINYITIMKKATIITALLTLILLVPVNMMAQDDKNRKPVAEMSKEEMSQLTYQDLLGLSLEDLMIVANKFGLSSDEILEYFLNKDVTSASKRAEKSLNSPLSTTVISKEEIINSGATSIPEALRLVPGMIVRQTTTGNYDVHIRGNDNLPPNDMLIYSINSISLVMIDGRPVYNYAFGGTFWETLPIELNDIERIEVIRGPSSALYGPNAVSGAINIITRSVESNKLKVNGQVQFGNNNSRLADASLSFGVAKNLKVRLSGNYTHFERSDDKFYVFNYDHKFTAAEMDTLRNHDGTTVVGTPAIGDFKKFFPNPALGVDKYAANAFFNYHPLEKFDVNLSLGAQQSDANTVALGNNEIPIVGRASSTWYGDLRVNAYGLQAQVNYMSGDQDIQKNYDGFHIQPDVFNASLEYEYTKGNLVLRPGISYQNSQYNDDRWVDINVKGGFLNGEKTLTSLAYYLRADYKAFNKLRLIAAIRGDSYNKPDATKFTYQFVGTFDINENNVIRGGYSRANRGSFMTDSYADYNWKIVPGYYTFLYQGNSNLKLPVMDMLELGYRTKLTKNIMVEIEAFHSVMDNLTFFHADQMKMYFDLTPVLMGGAPPTSPDSLISHGQYDNISLKSKQNGITANVSIVLNTNMNLRIFGTWQKTKLSHVYPRTIFDDLSSLKDQCVAQYMTDLYKLQNGDLSPLANPHKEYVADYSTYRDSSTVSMDNKSTPSFYGGLTLNYTALEKKLNVNTSFYFYTRQKLAMNKNNYIGRYSPAYVNNQDQYNPALFEDAYTIEPKLNMNLKISYKVWKDCSVFINARNILNNKHREFAFLDDVKGLYMLGMSLNF